MDRPTGSDSYLTHTAFVPILFLDGMYEYYIQ